MTVSQLESALADLPGDAEIRIAVGVFGGLAVQSIERLPEQPGMVWLANELDNDLTPEQAHAIVDRELGVRPKLAKPSGLDEVNATCREAIGMDFINTDAIRNAPLKLEGPFKGNNPMADD